jgi:hypothetical protein
VTGIVKPAKPAKATVSKTKKPAPGKLTAQLCNECERDILVGFAASGMVRLEPELITAAAEPALWALGQPTYALVHRGESIHPLLRIPSTEPPSADGELAIAHICDTSQIWMGHTLTCPQWWGYSRHIVAQVGLSVRIMRATELAGVYKEVFTCSTIEAAQEQVQRLNWRDRARQLA